MQRLLHRFNNLLKGLKLNGDIYKYLITALIILIPLYPKFPLFNIPGTYVSVRLEDILIFVCFVTFLPLIFKQVKELLANKIILSIIIFLFIGSVSLVSAIFVTQTVSPLIGILHLFRRFEYLSFFIFGYLYFVNYYRKGDISYFVKLLGLVIVFAFIYGILQRYFSFPIVITQNNESSKGVALRWIAGSHINSTFAGHYDLANYLVLILPIFVTSFFVLKDKYEKLFSIVIVTCGYWLFSNALSRISIVSFMIAVTISLLLFKKYKAIIIFGLISVVLFGFSTGLRDRYLRIYNVLKDKVSLVNTVYAQEVNVFEDRSTSIRLNVEWPRALRALSKNPLLGTGYSSITLATDNDYLRALGEVGILGFFAFVLIFVNIGKSIKEYKNYSQMDLVEKIFVTSIIGGTVGIVISAVFIDIFEASKFASSYWLMTGLLVGRLKIKQ